MTKNIASGNARVGAQIGRDNRVEGNAKVGTQRGGSGYTEAKSTPHPGYEVCDGCREAKTGRR